jgi:hypothetical protein
MTHITHRIRHLRQALTGASFLSGITLIVSSITGASAADLTHEETLYPAAFTQPFADSHLVLGMLLVLLAFALHSFYIVHRKHLAALHAARKRHARAFLPKIRKALRHR